MLILPQSALADPGGSISLFPDSGHCGDLIEATANVTAPGTYRICWNSRTPEYSLGTFTAYAAGNYTIAFYIPVTAKGVYTVYLTEEDYTELGNAYFLVFSSAQIDPEEGPVGTAVTVSGYGFTASQDIRVSFEDDVNTGKANTVGSWTVNYTIPATPGGGYTFDVEFQEGAIWYDLVGKYFKVTPEITAPSSGAVGKTIEVSGTGFQSKEKDIKVTFDGEAVKTDIDAGEDGSWEATIVVPPLQRGTYIVDASGMLTRARDVPDVNFILGAGILVEPALAYVGDTITVTGGGFATGETGIRVTFGGQVVASGITAKVDGTWESSFVLPASTFGSNTVSASGDITKPAVETYLNTKAKIEKLTPVEGAPGDSVTLSGSGFSSNKKLTVTVGGVGVSGNMETLANGNVVISFRVPASPEGKQTVTATDEGGATASAEFTVNKKVLPHPLPTLPKDESTLRSGQVTFDWLTSGSNMTYILQISETADFASVFQPQSGIGGNSYTLPEEEALPKGLYYWRVKVVDNYGNESPWSSPRSFTVSPIPTWVWVVVGVVVLVGLLVVAYRETKFKVT